MPSNGFHRAAGKIVARDHLAPGRSTGPATRNHVIPPCGAVKKNLKRARFLCGLSLNGERLGIVPLAGRRFASFQLLPANPYWRTMSWVNCAPQTPDPGRTGLHHLPDHLRSLVVRSAITSRTTQPWCPLPSWAGSGSNAPSQTGGVGFTSMITRLQPCSLSRTRSDLSRRDAKKSDRRHACRCRLGPPAQKSRLTSSSENGSYC